MTNYNKRLYEILDRVYLFGMNGGLDYEKFENELIPKEAKQVIISLVKELVAEAKPEVRVFDDGINDATYFQQKIADQFERNLLKELEENDG